MPKGAAPSPFSHGRSEIWDRKAIARAIRRELRKLGARLRELRRSRGHTLATAAEASGLHDNHLGHIERGAVNVSVGTLVALAKAYRVPLAEVFVEPPSGVSGGKEQPKNRAVSRRN
ncbi:MAG TPA: helix-turn-helix transcriptional regulator [Polyangiaceae bacterium]